MKTSCWYTRTKLDDKRESVASYGPWEFCRDIWGNLQSQIDRHQLKRDKANRKKRNSGGLSTFAASLQVPGVLDSTRQILPGKERCCNTLNLHFYLV